MIFVIVLAAISHFSIANAKQSDIASSQVIKLVNESRKEAGMGLLTENPKLKAAAENKIADMFEKNYFAHFSPEGKTPWDFIIEQKYDYRLAGENLAIDYTNAKEQHEAWMESEPHRQNILNPEYKEIGVASLEGTIYGRKTIITVQEFGTQNILISKTPSNDDIMGSSKAVAGFSTKLPSNTPRVELIANEFKQTATQQFEIGKIFEKNELTLAGWLAVVLIAVLATLFDVIFVFYKNRRQSW